MLVAKILFNSIISTVSAKFMTMDILNFYLMTPLKWPEYIQMKITNITNKIINEYNLHTTLSKNNSVYIMAIKGMYGLRQSGLLANKLLEKRLNHHHYFQSKYILGL
ncbi:hypothetical protein ACHAW6_006140 [Cyclotella cf. meneghiniana]